MKSLKKWKTKYGHELEHRIYRCERNHLFSEVTPVGFGTAKHVCRFCDSVGKEVGIKFFTTQSALLSKCLEATSNDGGLNVRPPSLDLIDRLNMVMLLGDYEGPDVSIEDLDGAIEELDTRAVISPYDKQPIPA